MSRLLQMRPGPPAAAGVSPQAQKEQPDQKKVSYKWQKHLSWKR
jgi:hypothetical protein